MNFKQLFVVLSLLCIGSMDAMQPAQTKILSISNQMPQAYIYGEFFSKNKPFSMITDSKMIAPGEDKDLNIIVDDNFSAISILTNIGRHSINELGNNFYITTDYFDKKQVDLHGSADLRPRGSIKIGNQYRIIINPNGSMTVAPVNK